MKYNLIFSLNIESIKNVMKKSLSILENGKSSNVHPFLVGTQSIKEYEVGLIYEKQLSLQVRFFYSHV